MQAERKDMGTREALEKIQAIHEYVMASPLDNGSLIEIDVHFFKLPINPSRAEEKKDEYASVIRDVYSHPVHCSPGEGLEYLKGGPSYIHAGGVLGSQELALVSFAVGTAMGLWDVITPKTIGIEGPQADEMAGMGFVMCTGLKEKGVVE